jgi:ribosome maturation factor RimP
MKATGIIQDIENHVVELISDQPALFLVQVKADVKNNIRIYLDGDNGVTIDQCAKLNRKLYKILETTPGFEEGDFSLEVSSAGLDEPLQTQRQYKKNIGRPVEVLLEDGTQQEGVLKEADEVKLVLECTTGKGKKQEIKMVEIPLAGIKATMIKIII